MLSIRRLGIVGALAIVVGGVAIGYPAYAEGGEQNSEEGQGAIVQLPPPTPGLPTPTPLPEVGITAMRDGVWHAGEFAVWRHSDYKGGIYDTSRYAHNRYYNLYYVNVDYKLWSGEGASNALNNVSSSANAYRTYTIHLHDEDNNQGSYVSHLTYPACGSSACYSYSYLGWANDRMQSHHGFQ